MKRPRVIANFAVTADGKVSTRNFTPTGFTSPADKQRLREIRALGDAVIAGARTVAADNMAMGLSDARLQAERVQRGQAPAPIRVIVSNSGAIDPRWKVFRKTDSPLVIFSTRRMKETLRAQLAKLADLWLFPAQHVDLPAALEILRGEYRVRTAVCEGGPSLFRALLEVQAVDELRLTWAPVIFGGAGAPTLTGVPGDFLPDTVHARLAAMEPHGGECFLTYRLKW